MTKWQQEQFMLEEMYVKRLLIDHGIREVTTQRQAKNETRLSFLYLHILSKDLSGMLNEAT